ncbi:MAG TPA: LytTR family DNA-binding domain-containing protein [Acidobacteriota bacterium]|nr:LytTR family DNA-binding domain-containing protein [Acidobacteriota bacterium]
MTAKPRKIGAVIVDDEELARKVVREYLQFYPEINVLAECANGFEAVKKIAELKPDLLFLDIQMPKLDGFEVLELIDQSVAAVFITAYDTHAMRAFDVHAVDYLLKPFGEERFREAVTRALTQIGRRAPSGAALTRAALQPGEYVERVVVKDGSRVYVIPAEKLDYVEAQDDYVCLKSEGKRYLRQQTISSLESALDPTHFVRLHRSYLVNLDRVVNIEPYTRDSRIAILKDNTRLPVSRSGYARLKELLEAGK